jgi:hypothetical protein
MSRDIGATSDDLNLAVSLFFVTFVLLQPPSAAIGRLLGAKNWIALMMVSLPMVLARVHACIANRVRSGGGHLPLLMRLSAVARRLLQCD